MLQKKRVIRIGAPIEWHAARTYTRVMFDKFSGELYASGGLAAIADIDDHYTYNDSRIMDGIGDNAVADHHKVRRKSGGSFYSCEHGMFEHMGMPCPHVLMVLMICTLKSSDKATCFV